MILSSIGSILDSLVRRSSAVGQPILAEFKFKRREAAGSPISGLFFDMASSLTVNPAESDDELLALRSHHVFLLSISSTLARLVTGAVADYLAPVVPSTSGGVRKTIISRSVLASVSLAVMSGVFLWGGVLLHTEQGLSVVSVGIGAAYGTFFTLT